MDIGQFGQLHQTTLWCMFATFLVGTVAGFQGLVARVPAEWSMALRTMYGSFYIVARGALPAILYVVLHRFRLLNLSNPVFEVLLLGGGSETFLRSRVLLIFKSAGPGQIPTEETKGPLDLVFWFQQFFIDRATSVLATQRIKAVSAYYDDPALRLEFLADGIDANAGALDKQADQARKVADSTRTEYIQAKAKAAAPFDARTERNWCRKLGYALYAELTLDNYHAISKVIVE
jgi:hypothetical protein